MNCIQWNYVQKKNKNEIEILKERYKSPEKKKTNY